MWYDTATRSVGYGAQNGNPPPEFRFEPEAVLVTVWRRP